MTFLFSASKPQTVYTVSVTSGKSNLNFLKVIGTRAELWLGLGKFYGPREALIKCTQFSVSVSLGIQTAVLNLS